MFLGVIIGLLVAVLIIVTRNRYSSGVEKIIRKLENQKKGSVFIPGDTEAGDWISSLEYPYENNQNK